MKVYGLEETEIGNYFKINYELSRQLIVIFDIFRHRLSGVHLVELDEIIIESTRYTDMARTKPVYDYDNLPSGIFYYASQHERPKDIKSFINWFLKHKQQPRDYLIHGILRHKTQKRNIGIDKTSMSSEYGGVPLEIDNGSGYKPAGFKRF